ncbi:MAG: hypothetical protein LBT70_04290 [Holosporaceae bacterium]|jgi:hypothetical protein|nr:hypothetical protein [Holosporaceae bacterium]
MKNFFMTASIAVLAIQCCQVESTQPRYGESVTSQSMSVRKQKWSTATPQSCVTYWTKALNENNMATLDEEGTFSNEDYAADTTRIIKGISVLEASKKFLAKQNPQDYSAGIAYLRKPIDSKSSLRRLAIHMVFFSPEEVNNEIIKRLRASASVNINESIEKRTSVMLEFVRMVSLISQIEFDDNRKGENTGKSYFSANILEEIETEIRFALEYQKNPQKKDMLEKEMVKRSMVGDDKDNIARMIVVMANTLLYSDVSNDNADGLYTEFIKAFPALRIGEWILKYCYLNNFKMDIGTRVAALTSTSEESNAFAEKAARELKTFDPQQAIRIIKNVNNLEYKKKILNNIVFDGQSADTKQVVNTKSYLKDLFSFIDLWCYYTKKDCLQYANILLKCSKIKVIDKEVLERMPDFLYPVIGRLLQDSDSGMGLDVAVALPFLERFIPQMAKISEKINHENYIVDIVRAIDFSNATDENLQEFIVKICTFPFRTTNNVNRSIIEIITQKSGRKINKDFALQLINNNDFRAFAELIEFVDDLHGAAPDLLEALLQRSNALDQNNLFQNMWLAVENIYSNSNVSLSPENLWKIISFAKNTKDYSKVVRIADTLSQQATSFSLEQCNSLIECVSDSRLDDVIRKTNLNDEAHLQMSKEISCKLIRVFPEEYLFDIFSKIDFANNLDDIVEALYYKFRSSRNIPRNLSRWYEIFEKISATGKVSPKTQGILNAFMEDDPLYAEDYLDFVREHLKIEDMSPRDHNFSEEKLCSYKVNGKELLAPHKEILMHAFLEFPLPTKIDIMPAFEKFHYIACMLVDYILSTPERIVTFKEYAALAATFFRPTDQCVKSRVEVVLGARLIIAVGSKLPIDYLRDGIKWGIAEARKEYETKGNGIECKQQAYRDMEELAMISALGAIPKGYTAPRSIAAPCAVPEIIIPPERIVMDMRKASEPEPIPVPIAEPAPKVATLDNNVNSRSSRPALSGYRINRRNSPAPWAESTRYTSPNPGGTYNGIDDTGDIDDTDYERVHEYSNYDTDEKDDDELSSSSSRASLSIAEEYRKACHKFFRELYANISSQRCDFILDDNQKALLKEYTFEYFQPQVHKKIPNYHLLPMYQYRGTKHKMQWEKMKDIDDSDPTSKMRTSYLSKFLGYSPSTSDAVSSSESDSTVPAKESEIEK